MEEMRRIAPIGVALVLVAVGSSSSLAGDQQYRVIVNSSRQIRVINQTDLADYFVKRQSGWSDGVPVDPVDLTMLSETRRSFTEDMLADNVEAILAYWERQISSGRKQPPPVKATDADVIAFVQAHAGAVGYISSKTLLPPGVDELKVVRADTQAARGLGYSHLDARPKLLPEGYILDAR